MTASSTSETRKDEITSAHVLTVTMVFIATVDNDYSAILKEISKSFQAVLQIASVFMHLVKWNQLCCKSLVNPSLLQVA